MIIYLNFIIPILAVLIVSLAFHKQVNILERILVFIVPAIVIVAAKFLSIAGMTMIPECLNSYTVKAKYYEDWDEWIEKTCTECVSRDTSGNCVKERTYDCSYREYHSPYWEIQDNMGKTYGVPESKYHLLVNLWDQNRVQFEDLHRDYYHNDGDLYYIIFDNQFDHTYPIVNRGLYENKVKCSKSVFNFQPVSIQEKSMYGLYDYPKFERYDYNPILGLRDYEASKKLSQYNAQLGTAKQVHMLLLVFHDKPYDAALYQEAYWKGGNKNEFILCVGVDAQNQTKWAKVISWTEVQDLKIKLERKIREMPFNATAIVDTMAKDVQYKFMRKHFKDFSYLTVEPTTSAVIISFIITLIVTIGICIVVIKYDLFE